MLRSTKNRSFTPLTIVLAALFLALGIALPFLTGQIPLVGNQLLPMHIPVLLGGFFLGAPLAALVGLILPVLRSVLFGAPPFFPSAVAMSFELAAYGFLTALFYRMFPRKNAFIYVNLVLAMLGGRFVWGMVSFVLYGLSGTPFTWALFLSKAFWTAGPGMIVQIVLIPALVTALNRDRRRIL